MGAAERAGSAIRNEIEAIMEAAQATAADIERNAEDSGEGEVKDARDAAARVVATIRAIESELAGLRRTVGTEHDSLRAKTDRALLSASVTTAALSPGATPRPAGLAEAADPDRTGVRGLLGGVSSAGEEAALDVELAAPEGEVPEADAQDPDAEAPDDPQGEAIDTGDPPMAVGATDKAIEPGTPGSDEMPDTDETPDTHETSVGGEMPEELSQAEPDRLDEEAENRVVGKTDLELAELYDIATDRAKSGPEAERSYWSALVTATVREAVGREHFGAPGAEEEARGRRARKRRANSLQHLAEAREGARTGSGKHPDSED